LIFSFSDHLEDDVAVPERHAVDPLEALLEVRLHELDVLRLGQDAGRRSEVEAREDRFRLEVVAEAALHELEQLVGQP
jgi:hypothetical protein